MRYIIFGTKKPGCGSRNISTYISNWKVMMSWCWIIKQPDPHLVNDKFGVYCFQSLVVQTIFIKQKISYDGRLRVGGKSKVTMPESFSVLRLEPLKANGKDFKCKVTHLCSKWLQMAPNGDVSPSPWYVVRVSVLHLWHIKSTFESCLATCVVPLNWLLSLLSSSSDFSSWVILY